MSSGRPIRRTIVRAAIAAKSASVRPAAAMSVRTNPGAIALTVMPWGPSSSAKRRVSTTTAALVAA